MSQGTVNTKSYLDYLRARRAKLDALIQAIEEFDDDGSSQDDPQSAQARPASTGTNREYRGMTIAAATIKFLKSKSEPQLTRTIADALRFGGLGSNSRNMYRTVYNTLMNRLDKHQDIVKEGAKWGLAEWRQQ